MVPEHRGRCLRAQRSCRDGARFLLPNGRSSFAIRNRSNFLSRFSSSATAAVRRREAQRSGDATRRGCSFGDCILPRLASPQSPSIFSFVRSKSGVASNYLLVLHNSPIDIPRWSTEVRGYSSNPRSMVGLHPLKAVYPAMTTHGCRSSFRD